METSNATFDMIWFVAVLSPLIWRTKVVELFMLFCGIKTPLKTPDFLIDWTRVLESNASVFDSVLYHLSSRLRD
jgi:hypothetical protein